jgi:hypothetical protein
MKSMTSRIAVASALAALSLSSVAADEGRSGKQAIERRHGTAAQVRGVGEVLGSWTGAIPAASREDTVAVAERGRLGARTGHARDATQLLASWTGSIPVEASARMSAHRSGDDPSGAHVSAATEALGSWSGWSSSRLTRRAGP